MSINILNSFSNTKSMINDPSIDNQMNSLLFYYYCPKCLKLPSIKLLKDYVEIQCSCGFKDGERKQKPNEDITQPEVLLEIVEYKKYKLLLKSYLKLIEINSKTKKICEQKFTHSDERKADVYCLNCDPQLFMCDSCKPMHDKIASKHKKIKSAGMKISEICEKKECERKGIIEYYCKDCRLHLCIGCQINEHKNHEVVDIKSFFEENKNSLKKKDFFNSFIDKIKQFISYSRCN